MDPVTPQILAVAASCLVATWTDLTEGKILNALTVPMMGLGVAVHATQGTFPIGMLVALAIHYPLWLLGVEKGGDAKLMMGIGALTSGGFVVELTLWCAVLYLPVGVLLLALQGKLGNLIATVRWSVYKAQGVDLGEAPEPTMVRTAPIIAVAAAMAWATPWIESILV